MRGTDTKARVRMLGEAFKASTISKCNLDAEKGECFDLVLILRDACGVPINHPEERFHSLVEAFSSSSAEIHSGEDSEAFSSKKRKQLRRWGGNYGRTELIRSRTHGISADKIPVRTLSRLFSTEIEKHNSTKAEDKKLWIASRLIWFNQPRPPDSSQTAPVKIGPSS
ncbi:hypothetical protein STEG23_000215 [Scotinomys teguina]